MNNIEETPKPYPKEVLSQIMDINSKVYKGKIEFLSEFDKNNLFSKLMEDKN